MHNESKRKGTVKVGRLNVRSGPGIKYEVLSVLEKSERIDIIYETYDSKGNKWYRINGYDKQEYVSANYVFTI